MFPGTPRMVLAVASGGSQDPAFRRFIQEFEKGADCQRLFEIRNEAKRTCFPEQREEMNTKLQFVGCYSSTSKRRWEPPQDAQLYSQGVGETASFFQDSMIQSSDMPNAVASRSSSFSGYCVFQTSRIDA